MRQVQSAPVRLALTNYRHAYWSAAQMVAHHTVNGCNLRDGDLFRQPDLARTLERLAAEGFDGFYRGETARLLIDGKLVAGSGGTFETINPDENVPLVTTPRCMTVSIQEL